MEQETTEITEINPLFPLFTPVQNAEVIAEASQSAIT